MSLRQRSKFVMP